MIDHKAKERNAVEEESRNCDLSEFVTSVKIHDTDAAETVKNWPTSLPLKTFDISGFWDATCSPLCTVGRRTITFRPMSVSLFGWQVWPTEWHITGEMDSKLTDETWEASMKVETVTEESSPILRRVVWTLVGCLVWWWRRRGDEEPDIS